MDGLSDGLKTDTVPNIDKLNGTSQFLQEPEQTRAVIAHEHVGSGGPEHMINAQGAHALGAVCTPSSISVMIKVDKPAMKPRMETAYTIEKHS